MRSLLSFGMLLWCILGNAYAIDQHPLGLAHEFCDSLDDHLDDPLPAIGNVHSIMVLATCSTSAMDPAHQFDAAYAMPSWRSLMFDPLREESLSRYFSDISYGAHQLSGNVVGRDSLHVVVSPFAPTWPEIGGNSGGPSFFKGIMERLDSVVDFNDYDLNQDGDVDYMFFALYGFCDGDWCPYKGRGFSGLPGSWQTFDTLPNGDSIWVRHGCTIWIPSDSAYPDDPDNAYWAAHGVAAHEYGHNVGADRGSHWGQGDGH